MITLIDNKLVLEIESSKFQWYYRFSDRFKFNKLVGQGNTCMFVGHGEYLCETDNSKFQLFLNSGIDISDQKYEIIKSTKKEWDFSKLTDQDKTEARQFIKAKNEKELIKFHNRHALSENHFCCNGKYVLGKFIDAAKKDLI